MEAKYLQNNLLQLKKSISQDRLVIFAGAGISFDSGLPLWKNLIEKIKKRLDFETEESDPLKIAQLLYNEKGEKEYNEILNSLIFESSTKANPIHKILFKLNPQHIVTTNYDYFFEEIISQDGLPFSTISKDENLPYAEHKNLLIKYHGDFENKNIVLKETDYLEFSKLNVLKEAFVKSLFSNKVILFVGYSFSDINLKILLRDVQYLLKRHQQKSYLIIPDSEIPNSEKLYFDNFGINIINYEESLFSKDYHLTELTDKGVKVYSILDFLINVRPFDQDYHFNDTADEINVIESCYQSLIRFKIFRVLPKRFIADLFPFNKDSKQLSVYNIDEHRMLILNHKLYLSLSNELKNSDSNSKSSYIKMVLLLSGINEIGYIDRATPYGQFIPKEENITEIVWTDSTEQCNCFTCILKRLDYKDLLKKIKAYRVSNSSDLFEDLKFAYTLFNIGDYLKSFHSFQDLLQKSNFQKRFDISYIAKFNLLHLSKFLHHAYVSNDELNEKEYEKLIKTAESIDLDEELQKLKFFYDQDVYNFYKDLNSGKSIHRLCIDLDTLKMTSLETLDRIKRGGSGGESFINLLNRIKELDNFLTLNHIIPDNNYEVNHSFQKSIESIIIGYELKEIPHNYEGLNLGKPHIMWIDYWICEMIIRRAIPYNFSKFLGKRILNNIEIQKEDKNKLFNLIFQFFENAYNQNKYFGGTTDAFNFKSHLETNETFKKIINSQFFNICILLAYLDFNKNELNRYIKPLINFLRYIDFNVHSNSYEYIDLFFKRKGNQIEPKQIEELLEIFYNKYKMNSTFYILLKFANKKTNLDFVDVREIDYNYYKFSSQYFYPLLNKEQKTIYRNGLRATAINENDTYLFFDAIYFKVVKDNDFISSYKTEINSILALKVDDTSKYKHNIIHQFITLYIENKINLDGIVIQDIQLDYYKFLFSIENFPEKDFDIFWLQFTRNKIIDEQISKLPYIYGLIEDYLSKNEDTSFQKIYFHLKKLRR